MSSLDQVLFKKFKDSFAKKTEEEIMEKHAFYISVGEDWEIGITVDGRKDSLRFYRNKILTVSPLDPDEHYKLVMLVNEFVRQLRDRIEHETWVGLRQDLVEELEYEKNMSRSY